MHLFDIITKGKPALPVFAASYDEAVHIYMAYWVTHYDAALPDFEVLKRNPDWPRLDTAKLAEALSSGLSGIGRYDDQAGWTIDLPTAGGRDLS